jgi:transposase InsO family protein
MLKKDHGQSAPTPDAGPEPSAGEAKAKERVVTAKRPNHVWHVDLTLVPTGTGMWASWLPFALPQCWPFCWWVAVVVDHFSRRIMGLTVFKAEPTSQAMRAYLGRVMHNARARPRYLICDKGGQLWSDGFKGWCRRKGIRPRFGAVGQHGSIAVIERLILTLKTGCTQLLLVRFRREAFLGELRLFADWYNRFRPHTTLGGRTPHEVYQRQPPANRAPRFEPRPRWPRSSPCARPQTLIKGQPGARVELQVTYHKGRKHLPVVMLLGAA